MSIPVNLHARLPRWTEVVLHCQEDKTDFQTHVLAELGTVNCTRRIAWRIAQWRRRRHRVTYYKPVWVEIAQRMKQRWHSCWEHQGEMLGHAQFIMGLTMSASKANCVTWVCLRHTRCTLCTLRSHVLPKPWQIPTQVVRTQKTTADVLVVIFMYWQSAVSLHVVI